MKNSCWPWRLTFDWLPSYKACSGHDDRYKNAKIRNAKTRAKIDRIFYYQMLAERKEDKITAKIYYYLVRLFWWTRFYF